MDSLSDLIVPIHYFDLFHTHYATFDSFYRSYSSCSWWSCWVFLTATAIIAGGLIFVSVGTASPFVAGIGTWVGGLMGYSGAAATSAGLALLGGGSIAAGGFGMAGGAALLTAALSFGTGLVFDYTVDRVWSEYSYQKMTELSESMLTLPLPKNWSGPDAYTDAMYILEDVDRDQPISDENTQEKILLAIEAIEDASYPLESWDRARVETFLALLHFVSNNYREAKIRAFNAKQLAEMAGIGRTVPAFIYATGLLYDEDVSLSESEYWFRQSILEEVHNPLVPLLFAIYLDRLTLRFGSGQRDDRELRDGYLRVFALMKEIEKDIEEKAGDSNYTFLLTRFFRLVKLQQQKVTSLALNPDHAAKSDPMVSEEIESALAAYMDLLDGTATVLRTVTQLSTGPDQVEKTSTFVELFLDYWNDRPRLGCLKFNADPPLNHHFANLDVSRSEIMALTNSLNQTIVNNPATIHRIEELLESYGLHLDAARTILDGNSPEALEKCLELRETRFLDDYVRFAKDQPKLVTQAGCFRAQRESVEGGSTLDRAVLWGSGPPSCRNLERWR